MEERKRTGVSEPSAKDPRLKVKHRVGGLACRKTFVKYVLENVKENPLLVWETKIRGESDMMMMM